MAAPLLAAGGRLVAGSARVKARRGVATDGKRALIAANDARQAAIVTHRSLQRQVKDLASSLSEAELQAAMGGTANINQKPKPVVKAAKTALRALRMAKVATVHTEMALFLGGLYVVQLVGYFLFLFGEYANSYWIVSQVDAYLIELDWIWQVGWGLGTLAGLIALLSLIFAYSAALVNWVKGWSPLVLALCATMYFVPHLLLVPWIVLWMTAVFWSK